MTLEEYIEKVKIEKQLSFDTKKMVNEVIDEARRKRDGNTVVCLSNEDVEKVILNIVNGQAAEIKEKPKPEVKKDEMQVSLFDL